MTVDASDTLMQAAAFDHVRRLCEVFDHLTAVDQETCSPPLTSSAS
jgi:hypothetical protein